MDYPTEVMNCVVRVDTRFVGWRVMLARVLDSIDGITYEINGEKGTAQLTGRINPRQLMKTLVEVGLNADLSPVSSGYGYGYGEMSIPPRHGYHDYGYHGGSYGYGERSIPSRYGYDYGYHGGSYGYNPYGRAEYHYGYPPPHRQTKWHPIYENYPQHHLQYDRNNPYYEPPAQYFPQPPPQPEGFRNGDPEWCTIM